MIRNIIFDLDGTLIDSLPGIERAVRQSWEEVFPGQVLPDLRPLMGPPIQKIFLAINPQLQAAEIEQLVGLFRPVYNQKICLEVKLFPGGFETLQALSQTGMRLFIATNKPRTPTVRIVEHLAIKPFFAEIVSPDSREPAFVDKAAMVQSLIDSHQLTSSATLLVGDALDDSRAAGECGLGFVAARYGYGGVQAEDFAHGRFDLDALADLPGRLFEFSSAFISH